MKLPRISARALILSLAALLLAASWITPRTESPTEILASRGLFREIKQPSAPAKPKPKPKMKMKTIVISPSPTPFIPDVNEIASLLRDDRLCEVFQAESAIDELVEALMSSSGAPDRVVTDAFRLFRRGVLADENSSEMTDFFNALALAGFVDGAKPIDTDLRESDRLLVGLKRRDSSNGANAFFRAAVLSEMGAGREAVRNEILEAFRAPRFDTHTTSLGRAIREKGFTSPSHFALAGMIIYKMPVPNYLFVSRLIHQFLEEKDREFARGAVSFARTLMRPALEVGGDHELLNWSALEYAIGSNLLAKAWAIAYPTHPEPNYPSYMDVLKREERVEGLFALALDDFRDLSAMARTGECRRANYDALFDAERAAYLEFSGH